MDARWTGGWTAQGPRGRYFRAKKSKISVPTLRNFVGFLQRPANLLTESHCRADFLLCLRSYESGAGMTDKFLLNDPEHWRARAEEARILAKEMKDSEIKDAMLRIGDNYEHLAEWVEDWALRRLSKN
jgi:hypothetical protein